MWANTRVWGELASERRRCTTPVEIRLSRDLATHPIRNERLANDSTTAGIDVRLPSSCHVPDSAGPQV